MITEIFKIINKNAFLIILILLLSFFSFQLGRVSKTTSQPIKIEKAAIQEIFTEIQNLNSESRGEQKIDFRVVASKNGSRYHFLWCPGAKQIKEENKIYFNSEEEAISAGYSLAANCSK